MLINSNTMIQSRALVSRTCFKFLFDSQRRALGGKKISDMIGPADPVSNLHHIKYAVPENETLLERKLREHREELQKWNEMFWTKHNLSFIQKKREFEKSELSKKDSNNQILTADEISVFYKQFLDGNWKTHLKYLLMWYKGNIYVTFLHFKVKIEKIYKKR